MRYLWLLGPARVEASVNAHSETSRTPDGLPRFRSRRTVGLLGYLVAERRTIARGRLLSLFWPDEEPKKARANLSREFHSLKRILPGCWNLDRQAAAFVPDHDTFVDLDQLCRLVNNELWWEAAELLGGEFLEGLQLNHNPEFEFWLTCERRRWQELAVTVLMHVVAGHARRGSYADGLRWAWRLLQSAPWDEGAHRWVMLLLAETGNRGDAVRHCEACTQLMWQELGVRPAPETVELCRQIQAGSWNLPT